MITLASFGPAFGHFDLSPFVVKTAVQLTMAGLPFETVTGFEAYRKAPRGKLPYIVDDGRLITDSDVIERHISSKYGFDFYAGYGAVARAKAHAVQQMVEERLYFLLLRFRWMNDANFAAIRPMIGLGAPFPLRALIPLLARRGTLATLKGQGIGRLSDEEAALFARQDIEALALLIGDKPFLLGDEPCGADASLYAHLAGALIAKCPSPAGAAVREHPALLAYVKRMNELYGI